MPVSRRVELRTSLAVPPRTLPLGYEGQQLADSLLLAELVADDAWTSYQLTMFSLATIAARRNSGTALR
eukprot:8891736-Pyramimonas_sp.AAC.1